jgi:intracellular sulfur oxidation DsrE/DsrF family protein
LTALQQRGVRFLGCGRSFNALAATLAGAGGDVSALEAELHAGVLPGVMIVPAMVIAVNRAQESGITYCAVT